MEPFADKMTPEPKPARFQFGLRGLMAATAAWALLFAFFRWLGLTPSASLFVAALLTVSLAAAFGLVLVLARSSVPGEDEHD